MDSPNNLDTNGSLQINSFAELSAEIAQVKFNGALRVSHEAQKIAVYFDAGEIIFAVSNARRHRLFELLLQSEKITQEQLTAFPQFTNDLALRDYLLENKMFEPRALDVLLAEQIAAIIKTAADWRAGEWTFSPLVRFKGAAQFPIAWRNVLLEHARHLPPEEINRKLNDAQAVFNATDAAPVGVDLSTRESFVFSRFEKMSLPLAEIQTVSGLPDDETRGIIYALWLGGWLVREHWNAAFSERKTAAILAARISLKKDESPPISASDAAPDAAAPPLNAAEIEEPSVIEVSSEKQISVEDYLARVENAANFYEIFAVTTAAAAPEIKQSYFGLAKRFHPDLYHKTTDAELLRRIQAAFTVLAQAYDTLKMTDSRELYDFKIRKELAEIKAVEQSETTPEEIDARKQDDQAAENFERGYSLVMQGNNPAAVPFLARAVHFAKDNARCHAFYGKALAADSKHRHKAESELQTAVKLDAANAEYRLMLAEFFVQYNLPKRAEGELNRLLQIFPKHREAERLLDSLSKK